MREKPNREDRYRAVTDALLKLLVAGSIPWRQSWGKRGKKEAVAPAPRVRQLSVSTGRPYTGINTLILWANSLEGGYRSPHWGTYKAWQDKDCQVRKGERSACVVYFNLVEVEKKTED